MAAVPAESRAALRIDLLSAMSQSRTRGNLSRARSRNKLWNVWCTFCHELNLSHFLLDVDDAIPILLTFMLRYRDGRIALQGNPVRARTVEDVARQIGETFEQLGATNIRLNAQGRIDTRVSGIIAHWKQQDPPPDRVRAVPLIIIIRAVEMCYAANDVTYSCLGDMILIGFFFVCRPGEYTAGTDSCRPFRFGDAQLFQGPLKLDLATATFDAMLQASFASLMFTNQKNAVPGETIGIGRSGHALACAIPPIARRLEYLRTNGAAPDTPLCAHKLNNRWYVITATQVTNALRSAVSLYGKPYGLEPHQVSARSLRSSGALAMMCGGVDTARGRLQGRWLSDIMFRYLSVQNEPLCADIGRRMVAGGNFDTIPAAVNPGAPEAAAILPQADDVPAMAAIIARHNPQASD